MSPFDELLEAYEKMRAAEPVTVRIECRSIDVLRRYTGTQRRETDALGVADWTGIPVYETDEVPPGVLRAIKSDGSHHDLSVAVSGVVHPKTGQAYAWEFAPWDVPLAECPAWLLELVRERPTGAVCPCCGSTNTRRQG